MGVASFMIGLLPTYASIGLWAPGLLVFLRFLQGFALGGECTGAQLLTMEHAPADRRGFFGSLINVGAPTAQVLSNGLLFLIAATMTSEQFMSFGWRIPFLLSIVLVVLGVYIRLKVEETPAFQHMKEHLKTAKPGHHRRASMTSVLRTHGRHSSAIADVLGCSIRLLLRRDRFLARIPDENGRHFKSDRFPVPDRC